MRDVAVTLDSRRRWTRADTLAASIVTMVAGVSRMVRLATPSGLFFDESFYARDACWLVHHNKSVCGVAGEVAQEHPPLGKWIIALGIRLFGPGPFGSRIGPVIAGTLTVLLVYVLARYLLRSAFGATIASGLLAIDFLHFVESRTALLDVFVTLFAVAAFLCCWLDVESLQRAGQAAFRLRRRWFDRPWRLAAGAMGGAAAACKWSGWPILATVACLTLFAEYSRRVNPSLMGRLRETLKDERGSLLLGFVVIPIVIYTTSYVGVVHGSLLAWPWSPNAWIRAVLARQYRMLDYHALLHGSHPYASPPWSWLLLKRPVVFVFFIPGEYAEVLATGSPLVWWLSIPALFYVTSKLIRRRILDAEAFIVAGFAAGYLPWLLVLQSRTLSFLYYLLPSVPFMCLAIAYACCRLNISRWGKPVVAAFAAAAIALFVFYYPVMTAVPTSYTSWRARMIFRDCGDHVFRAGDRSFPNLGTGRPPTGWCWI